MQNLTLLYIYANCVRWTFLQVRYHLRLYRIHRWKSTSLKTDIIFNREKPQIFPARKFLFAISGKLRARRKRGAKVEDAEERKPVSTVTPRWRRAALLHSPGLNSQYQPATLPFTLALSLFLNRVTPMEYITRRLSVIYARNASGSCSNTHRFTRARACTQRNRSTARTTLKFATPRSAISIWNLSLLAPVPTFSYVSTIKGTNKGHCAFLCIHGNWLKACSGGRCRDTLGIMGCDGRWFAKLVSETGVRSVSLLYEVSMVGCKVKIDLSREEVRWRDRIERWWKRQLKIYGPLLRQITPRTLLPYYRRKVFVSEVWI